MKFPSLLTLTLLMTRILADNEHLAMASNDFALVAHFLDRRTYLHNSIPFGYAFTLSTRPAADGSL